MKSKILVTLFASVLFLTGCSTGGDNQDAKHMDAIHANLESISSLERDISTIQKPLRDMERIESALFDEMADLGINDEKELKQKSLEAIELAKKRIEVMKDENTRIDKIKGHLEVVKTHSKELGVSSLKRLSDESLKLAEEKLSSYQKLIDNYILAAGMDVTAYDKLGYIGSDIGEIEGLLLNVRDAYKVVAEDQNKFNSLAKEFNEKKKELYKKAGYKVEEKTKAE